MLMIRRVYAVVLGASALAWFASGCRDHVHVYNTPANAGYGIMYDGRTFGGKRYQDSPHRANLVPQNISAVRYRTGLDTVIAFAPERAPVFKHVEWSWKIDMVDLHLEEAVEIPCKFHPVHDLTWSSVLYTIPGTPPIDVTLSDKVQMWVDSTNDVYSAERFGVYVTRTDGPQVSIPSGTRDDSYSHAQALTGAAHEPKMVNVYLMKEVFWSPYAGYWTKDGNASPSPVKPVILLGYLATEVLLGHEIGHGLGLAHTDGCPCFDEGDDGETNLMDKDSGNKRCYVTEGQTLRAHFGKESFLHDADVPGLHFRAGISSYTFSAKRSGSDPKFGDYPPTSWRIWPDHPEPANKRFGNAPECSHGTDGAAVDAANDVGKCRDIVFGESGDISADDYLRLFCRVGDATNADKVLRQIADGDDGRQLAFESNFISVLKGEVDSEDEERLRELLKTRDARRTKWIMDSPLSRKRAKEELARSRKWTGKRYIDAVMLSARLARRAGAMRGLVVIGSDEGIERVRQLANSETLVIRDAALSALLLLKNKDADDG